MFVGFSVGSTDWLQSELAGTRDDAERYERLAQIGQEEARLTHAMGGNMLRVFLAPALAFARLSDAPLKLSALPDAYQEPWYMLPEEEKVAACDRVWKFLTHARQTLAEAPSAADVFSLRDLDAYIAGVQRYGAEDPSAHQSPPVKLLITFVLLPPRAILEAPSDATLAHHGRAYTFRGLWQAYLDLHAVLARTLVQRYVVQPGAKRVVQAFELNNEPDYEWLPDEVRIEKSARPETNAIRKYVTELHFAQIPDRDDPGAGYEPTPWGGFRVQTGPWLTQATRRGPAAIVDRLAGRLRRAGNSSVLNFNWGSKFDWYVRCYAEFAEHFSSAFWLESRSSGSELDIISAGVTHNNIDYLVRMYRANPRCFEYCTGIGLHPYHWPGHDIYNKQFWRKRRPGGWRNATPRAFAADYFKNFDFITEVWKLTRQRGRRACGLEGKQIWLTEFGLPTKLPGAYNEVAAEHTPFIRPRSWPADAIPFKSVVWEDLWEAFFNQVQPALLERYGVRALFFYSLRETGRPSFDKHDDDRSNFAVLRRNGLPRMDIRTMDRFRRFVSSATGAVRSSTGIVFRRIPPWGRGKVFSSQLLRSEPWRAVALPAEVERCLSMLTPDEKRLLFWLGSEYFEGGGEIVDAGCFVGGSTVALAAGLATTHGLPGRGETPAHVIRSFDRFIADSFMAQAYFEPNKLALDEDRFRTVFDDNTRAFASVIQVSDGDITASPWSKRPIEILFLDIAKTWEVNDYCVREFFPSLVPGKSILVQQDFFHHREFWLIATQELLWDKFEYLGFVKWNSAVFRCVEPIDPRMLPERLRDLGLEELDRLVRRHIARYDDPYLVGMLYCALAFLHLDFSDVETAREIHADVATRFSEHEWVRQALLDLSGELAAREPAREHPGEQLLVPR